MIKSVIFVTGSLADGGAEKVMSILASGCAELGADVTLVVLRPKKIVYPSHYFVIYNDCKYWVEKKSNHV